MKKTMLVVLGAVCALCANVFAQAQSIGDTTTTWEVDETGTVLIIGGTGDMPNWNYSEADTSKRPWNDIRSSITSVIIRKGVTKLGVNAFVWCDSLTNITMSTSVTNIEEQAFGGCTQLKCVIIPSGVTCIGPNAFTGCNFLDSVIMNSKTPPELGSGAFGGMFFGTIYVPVGCKGAYASASGWSGYADKLVENVDGPWSIGDGVTARLDNKTLVIEGSGTMDDFASIEDVPWKADGIEKVTIGEGVTKIGKNAWLGMSDAVVIDNVQLLRYAFISGGFAPAEPVIPEGMILVTKESITKAKAKTIAVVNGEVQLGISVKYSEDITAEPTMWKELDPFAIVIPVKSKQGFMIVR